MWNTVMSANQTQTKFSLDTTNTSAIISTRLFVYCEPTGSPTLFVTCSITTGRLGWHSNNRYTTAQSSRHTTALSLTAMMQSITRYTQGAARIDLSN